MSENHPEAFDFVLAGGQLARMPSTLRYPMPPPPPKDQKDPDYLLAVEVYKFKKLMFEAESAKVVYFTIETLVCESGCVVRGKALNFNPYVGEARKGLLLGDGKIQVVPSPPAPKKNNQKGGNK